MKKFLAARGTCKLDFHQNLFIGAGIVYGLLDMLKVEFSRALILGALAGGYAAYVGVSWREAYTFLASAGW